eukprot:TRINITY_DN821_c0_g1_i1.p1 TRINITY_DN821_c0_g1~~TRINITY_DN821_c0_g1_i1.p1  ORF type:complete len:507 (-),score=180.22 TRINITY_DN821_c0_g1_i1:109-1596(-)
MERIQRIASHLTPSSVTYGPEPVPTAAAPKEEKKANKEGYVTIQLKDANGNPTGKSIDVPIKNGTIKATEFGKLDVTLYDPGYMNTASATSRITYIDGDKGILLYRGYPIEQLAESSNFMEVAFLLINGHLPTKTQNETWRKHIMTHTFIHENLISLMQNFRYDAHPMGMLVSSVAALATFYPEANPALRGEGVYKDRTLRNKQIYRIIGKITTIAACAYRHRIGRPYNQPSDQLDFTANFLYMLDHLSESSFKPHPKLVHALDVLFILHADHEMNCSTAAVRHVASAGTDPYTAISAAASALYGPLHGGANEAVLRMLEEIGTVDKIPQFIEDVKNRKKKLMGFGHRVYKNYDPRAKIIRRIAYEVFDVVGREPLIEVATALEQIALKDEYFVSRKLYPNVDFYSGLIYKAMGFPTDMFPVLFAIPRTVGWLAHWLELQDDPELRIVRPKQVYVGEETRDYVPMASRKEEKTPFVTEQMYYSSQNKRWHVSEKR